MGRIKTSEQRTDGTTYPFEYAYNLAGALIEETYPSTRVVKYTLNADGELAQVQSKKNSNSGYWKYADAFSYNAAGTVTKMQLGNGRWETAEYNDRQQVTMIGLGTTADVQDLLKLEFRYGVWDGSTLDESKNNGSMAEQKITVPAVGSNPTFTAVQKYTYDSLNRIHDATETVSSTQTWKQTFTYDRYGNRRFDTTNNNTTTIPSGCSAAVCNPDINTSNNRLSSSQGYDHDQNGALVEDALGQRFGYDAESHQKEFFDASNSGSVPDATYHYDGEGRRVKKVVGTEVTIFVYDAAGQLASEYSTTIASTQDAQVSYLTADHLGSPRIITDENGAVTNRKDFTAFGETVTSSQRVAGTGGNNYDDPQSVIRQDYTGYEKDGESGLEFAQARYYNPEHGRFTSVDPLTASAAIRDPQSFNRYMYGLNNPFKFVDPLGLYTCADDVDGQKKCSSKNDKKFESELSNARMQLETIRDTYGTGSEEFQNAKNALDAYGEAGVDNGVTVGFGTLATGILGETNGVIDGNGNKQIQVTIDMKQNKSSAKLLTTIAHEGSHVADRAALARPAGLAFALEAAFPNFAAGVYESVVNYDALNLTSNQTETKAFQVTSVFAQFLLKAEEGISGSIGNTTFRTNPVRETMTIGTTGISVWEPSWKGQTIPEIRAIRKTNIAAGLAADPHYSKIAGERLIPR